MGACLSKKNKTSTSSPPRSTKSLSTPPIHQQNSHNNVIETLSKQENRNNNIVQDKQPDPEILKQHEEESQPKKEIFIIKHRKSHDEREQNPTKINDGLVSSSETESLNNNNNNNSSNNKVGAVVVGVRTSSCTKEEVDAILIQCGRLSRSSSGKAASSSTRKYSGSKRSFDFDHSENNDTISAEDEQRRTNPSDNSEENDGGARHNNRQRHRSSPKGGRRRTPSREREREREQRSSSRERRVSRSPGRRSSDANTANESNNAGSGSGSGSRPGKMVTVPATVSSLVMDKSNNGGGESVKRNIASPRSMSPARVNGNGVNQNQHQNQQQPSLSRSNSARKTEVSPFRRNPLSEVDPNSLAYPQSNGNNAGNKVQNKHKKEIEAETIQKPKAETRDNTRNRTNSRGTLEKGVISVTKDQQEDEIKVMSDNAIVKNVVMPTRITRSRSSRRSRDLDNMNPETLTNPPPASYTSLLLEDIHNFHQKTTTTQPSVSLPACLNKACSILEAVADLNSTTSSTFSRNKSNVVPESSFVEESEVVVSDDVMEPSLHKYVTVKRGGSFSLCEDQESSGSNSFSLNSGQQQQNWNNCSSDDSPDCWSSRLMKRRECDHQHSGGIGRGRLATTSSST